MDKQELIDNVLAQIVIDVEAGDVTAIEELIKNINDEDLKAFLSSVDEGSRQHLVDKWKD